MTAAVQLTKQGRPVGDRLDDQASGFDFSDLRVFTSIPSHHHDVVVMRGLVAVYDTDCIGREVIQIGKLYVREHQRPYAMRSWEEWLKHEWAERDRRCGPAVRLKTTREVVQAINWPDENGLSLRMASGGVDGPYYDWAFGTDLIGKVVGLYQPTPLRGSN